MMTSVWVIAVSMAAVMSFVIAGTQPARAQGCPPDKTAAECVRLGLRSTAKTAGLGEEPKQTLPQIIGNLINAALSMLGIIFLILMLYGGYIWMQAKGNTEDIDKAKKIIENAIIGIVVIGLAFAITNFVLDQITNAQT